MPAIDPSGQGGGGGSGAPGAAGPSAYQLAVTNDGFVGTLQQWLASLKGADGVDGVDGVDGEDGAPAPHPLLTTGLTGGTAGNIVIRSLTDPSSASDVVNTMKDVLFDGSPLYYKASTGEYYGPGGVIPGTFAPGDVGKLVALGDKASANGSNLVLYTRGVPPASLTPLATRVFQPLGVVESSTSWRFQQLAPVTEADNPVQSFESFQSVANGAAPPNSLVQEQWSSLNETLSVVVDAGNTPTWPQGRYLRQNMVTSAPRHALSQMDKGQFIDGSVGMTFAVPAGQALSGRAARVYLRTSGSANSETALAVELDLNTGLLKLYTYNGGTASATLATTTTNAITGGGSAPLLAATLYRLEAQVYGNRLRARAYIPGGTVPNWQVETYQSTVNGNGYAAVTGTGFPTDFRIGNVAVTVNYGDLKATP
jgi:hypothetical protein